MSDIINILPDSVANQIAAGEVVDRPAGAVKELLENAMDAGADHIQLVVKDAGRTLIQVIDNGCGMSDSDARLCFERHATSKIHRADDLFAIRTMGFRGEALASIAAVAQVELKTRQHDSEMGSCVCIEGSQVKDQYPCSCPTGTSIAVKNLFFNIPARRNFLKKDSIELNHIIEIFIRTTLPNPSVAFSMYHNGKLLFDLKAGNLAQRITGLFGMNFKERLYHIQEQTEPVKINGYVGKAEFVKRTRGEQYLFVNNRFIKHPSLSAAIEKAYAELIPEGTHPAYFVMLDVDPSRIDVNIHPTKTEVRFIDEHVIFSILRAATKKALGQFSLANEIEFNPSTEIDFTPARKDYIPPAPTVTYNPHYNPFEGSRKDNTTNNSFFDRQSIIQETRIEKLPELIDTETIEKTTEQDAKSITFQERYIVTTLKSGIAIIDSQRACERIFYERLLARRKEGKSFAQQLLFPVSCSFSANDAELLSELLPELKELGFIIEPLGKNTYVVTAAPTEVKDDELTVLLAQFIADYRAGMLEVQTKLNNCDRTCLSVARQMAARPRRQLQKEEVQQIIADLFSCQVPEITPSGKRTLFILSDSDIASHLLNH